MPPLHLHLHPRPQLLTRHLNLNPTTHLHLPQTPHRFYASTPLPSSFASSPSPPRLPKEEQDRYESLQRASTGAFSTPTSAPTHSSSSSEPTTGNVNVVVEKIPPSSSPSSSSSSSPQEPETATVVDARVRATGKGEELHADVRRGAKPEFEGEVNPKTGEVGGPKNEPLRWGVGGDWSYNGRVTDF